MKHVIIIADGAADIPLPELGGQTPLEAARTPNLDRLARSGRLGTVRTTPPGFEAGSDVCSMCLLGYDPARFHTGRAPLEAAALGLSLLPSDWVFRLNLVTVGAPGTTDAGLMLDHSAGAISSEEGRVLIASIADAWRKSSPSLAQAMTLTPGVSYRNILVDSGATGVRDYRAVLTTPPHEIPRRPWAAHRPAATSKTPESVRAAAALNELMDSAAAAIHTHPINTARVAAGKRPANAAWIWGQGTRPNMPPFVERYGWRGAMITAVDLLAGLAALMGWDRIDCPGITSYHDTDYAMQGKVTREAAEKLGIVCCHVESPDEASHQGDWKTKVAAIEAIDAHVIGPVAEALEQSHAARGGGWRMLVMPDHATLISTRRHNAAPPPWLIAGTDVAPGKAARFTEREALAHGTGLIDPGDALMELFLRGVLSSKTLSPREGAGGGPAPHSSDPRA